MSPGLEELEASNRAADSEFGNAPADRAAKQCGSHHFLHARIQGPDGQPLRNERCTIELDDGTSLERFLDSNGEVFEEGVAPGTFRLVFPDLGAKPASDFLHLKVAGVDGAPLRNERCTIELPDGTSIERALDEHGELFEEGVARGRCRISFPDRGAHPAEA